LSGLQRHRLVTAAHTVIVGAAFFEALQELVGDEQYRQLDLSRTEQEWLLTGESGSDGERLLHLVYFSPLPVASPARGFADNLDAISRWYLDAAERLALFAAGLSSTTDPVWRHQSAARLADLATDHYQSRYLKMAVTVPEFAIWQVFQEHAVTQTSLSELRAEVLRLGHGTGGRFLAWRDCSGPRSEPSRPTARRSPMSRSSSAERTVASWAS
jgi:hypothetical protein